MDSDLLTGSPAPWLAALLAALAALAAVAALLRSRTRGRRALEQVLAQTEELRGEVEALRRSARAVEGGGLPYVITGVGEDEDDDEDECRDSPAEREPGAAPATRPASADGRIDGRLFADLVLRESVVKSAGLVHGVRRALAPETRHRIRFEMARELKRARRQRRADLRAGRRRAQAEQRGTDDPSGAADLSREGAA